MADCERVHLRIEGQPYSADVTWISEPPQDDDVLTADLQARIQPPCDLEERFIGYHTVGHTTIEHIATTHNASLFEVEAAGEGEDYDELVHNGVESIRTIVEHLNKIADLTAAEF